MDDNTNESEDDFLMSFTPRQAQTCGGQSIFFSFSGKKSPIKEKSFYFIVFEGSELRHVTSAKVINPYTLQAVIPEHNLSESTMMSICHSKDGVTTIVATDKFSFTLDSTYLLAQSLAMNSLNGFALTQLEGLYQNFLNAETEELKAMDHRLTASFKQLNLPLSWRLAPPLTEDVNANTSAWSLLHFCAKFNLMKLAEYLIDRAGAAEAIQLLSQDGLTPIDIARTLGNEAVMEVLTRVPAEEKIKEKPSLKTSCPSVKGHKLGTTTITNSNTGGQQGLEEDVRLLEELHLLAKETKKSKLKHSSHSDDDEDPDSENEAGPLATSLLKLKKINQEIQRLRDLSSENCLEGRQRTSSCPSSMRFYDIGKENGYTDAVVNLQSETENGQLSTLSEDEFEDGERYTGPIGTSRSTPNVSTTSIEEDDDDGETTLKPEEPEQTSDVEDANENAFEGDSDADSHHEDESGTPGKANNETAVDSDAGSESSDEENESQPNAENVHDNDGVDDSEIRGLASVAEETEEELEQAELDKEQVRKRLEEANKKEEIVAVEEAEVEAEVEVTVEEKPSPILQERSISSGSGVEKEEVRDEPKIVTERKSSYPILALRRERPLSDSLENLRTVEKEAGLSSLGGQKSSRGGFGFLNKLKSRSLDALSFGNDKEKSSMKTSSQLSLNRSTESILSEPDSPETTRSDSISRESRHSHDTSQLSLNDVCFSFSSQEDETVSERKGFPFRFSFKKAKSLTSLEMKKNKKQEEEDDRRKTIMGGICTDMVSMRRTQEMENYSEYQTPSRSQDHLGTFVLARYNTQTSEEKSSNELVVTVQPPKPERIRSTSDIGSHKVPLESESDTDEGTSTVIESKEKDKKGDKDRRFNILRSKNKKKVKEKEKEKDKKEKDVEKTIKEKMQKKSHKANHTSKSEGKSSFLGKRGTSFRQSLRSVPSPLPSQQEQKMFQRASSIGPSSSAAVRHSASLSTLRASGNKSPTQLRRTTVHDIDGHFEAESLPDLSLLRHQSTSRTSLDLETFYDEDLQDGHLGDYLAEYDSDLDLKDEPETWSELVDKKVQRKMHAKDIKRQDVIYELILTESNYVRTLNIMYKIYYCGIVREMHLDSNKIDQIFPRLEDLLDINGKFLADLKTRQQNSDNNVIESIGDILLEHWGGEKGELMKEVYGYFCSRHLQAVALYKDLLKTDKNFANFIKNCMMKERVRRLSIPECITLVTQRLTKYPLLIEAIIKATKEAKTDYNSLKKSLKMIKGILTGVDDYVREYEKEKRLEEIQKRLDPKGEVQLKTSKKIYKVVKLFPKRSKLIFDGTVTWRGKSKTVETMAVLLSTRLVFLQEKDNSKYTVLSVDQKSPVVSLKNLMVREVATDHKALFLVSTSTEGPDMYEMVFQSSRERKNWMELISKAIKDCPEEEEENLSDLEEEFRKEEESKTTKLKEIVEQLNLMNVQISALVADKNKVVAEMRELLEKVDSSSGKPSSGVEMKQIDVLNARETLDSAINEVSILTSLISGVDSPIFSPSPSPTTPNINTSTKRAETFGGFDARPNQKQPPSGGSVGRASSMRHDLKVNTKSSGSLEVDAGVNNKDPKGVRRPSQGGMLLSVLGRTKTMGSQEDLSSLGTSTTSVMSASSLTPQLLSLGQLKEYLMLLLEVTNKQDLEVASVRLALQEARNELSKARTEKTELEERLAIQQKEHEKLMSRQQEHYLKLQREFKRTIDKMQRQFNEHKVTDPSSDVQRYVQGSLGNMKSSGKNKHSKHKNSADRSNTPPVSHSGDGSHDTIETHNVIYF